MDFLQKLDSMMEKYSLNRRSLSQKSGIPYTTIDGWYKKGYEGMKISTLRILADYFNTLLDFWIQDDITNPNYGKSEIPGEESSSYSEGALKLADAYDNDLDFHGKRMVQIVVDEEKARMKTEESLMKSPNAAPEPKVINLFVEPSAAGIAVPTMGRDYEPYELKPEDPPGAAYAVRIQGDSMEPDFPDGSIIFVNHDAMRDGDIGIFSVDGGTVCKQYHKEGGVVYLFSLNRRRADADLVLFPGGNRSFVCQGRVITRRRYPVPGRE